MKTSTVKIAIADDHVLFRRGVIELLNANSQCSVVIEAENGEALIDKISASSTLPDICLLDISMPKMNGYDTLIKLKKEWPAIKVLILSIYDHEFSIIKMLKHGAAGYISKADDIDKLFNAISVAHEKGYYHSELVARHISDILKGQHMPGHYELNERELEFLTFCCQDYTYTQIAQMMHLSQRTVEGYRDALFHKLNIKSRSALITFALRAGIVPISSHS